MTKKQIQALIDSKTEEMNGYIAIKETLETNLETITTTKSGLDEGIYTPIATPYPLEGEGGEDWSGDNEVEADGLNGDISSDMGTYDGDVDTLSGEISQDIADLTDKISELEEEIKELQEALLTAPDEEPESSGGGGGGTSYTAVM
ncbi:hypothetical protein [Butyrivibrio proteoclasticus]|uniref:hypothetical protein n=1 Tax=Butyrivibrio proteoclasticus TaxID=43305 RepID=UPI0004789EC6|nr:hypothetical protein [Butyrivibrio proteoclasticus]